PVPPRRCRALGHVRARTLGPARPPAGARDHRIEPLEVTRTVLENLKRLGVRISLDDFGTGYASLSYLHHFPLDKVKIDRSFIKDVEASSRSRKLLTGVARLTADLGMSVVVEGVETRPQLALLMRQSSIEEVQGFLFSP